MSDQVVQFKTSTKPKSHTRIYRKHHIIITFLPNADDEKRWRWNFVHRPELHFSGVASTPNLALRSAKQKVDFVLDGQR